MPVRHVVAAANVDSSGFVIDSSQAYHCVIAAGRLLDLSGKVDPKTHLNLDFPEHTLGDCLIAETLKRGSRVRLDADGQLVFAAAPQEALAHLSPVNVDVRRVAWLEVLRGRREARAAGRE
jgi:hypothetical protein